MSAPKNIVLIMGMAGSGKGTQAAKLAERYGWQHVEMGNLLRQRARQDDAFGAEIRASIDAGKHLPPQIPLRVFEEVVPAANDGRTLLLDGFPRSSTQDRLFWDWCRMRGWPEPRLAIWLDVPAEKVLPRLLERAKKTLFPTPQHPYDIGQKVERHDDYETAIRERIAYFQDRTRSIFEWYNFQGRLVQINGDQTPDAVTAELFAKTEGWMKDNNLEGAF